MKKILILSLLLAPIFSFASIPSCKNGDLFDANTGHRCPSVIPTDVQSLINTIDSLKKTITELQNQIALLKGVKIDTTSSTNPITKDIYGNVVDTFTGKSSVPSKSWEPRGEDGSIVEGSTTTVKWISRDINMNITEERVCDMNDYCWTIKK